MISAFRRIITALTAPFRMLLVKVQKMFNVNILSAKITKPLVKKIKDLTKIKPKSKDDYVKVGGLLVAKYLFVLVVLGLCAGVFLYFSMFAPSIEPAPTTLTQIKTNITYRYDDIKIKEFSGAANIKNHEGQVVFTGEIANGVCKGYGNLFRNDGSLLYDGNFEQNQYSGKGKKYYKEGGLNYEGDFLENLYSGEGKLYSSEGKLLYDGFFEQGEYSGTGTLYSQGGAISYQGNFALGRRHGSGNVYDEGGYLAYEGDFFEDKRQGTGSIYNAAGKIVYTGLMKDDKVNVEAILAASLTEVQEMFPETPTIFYDNKGNNCFLFEEMRFILTTNCRVMVHEWVTPEEPPSDDPIFYDESYVEEEPFFAGEGTETISQRAEESSPLSALIKPMAWQIVTRPDASASEEGGAGTASIGDTSPSTTPGGGNSAGATSEGAGGRYGDSSQSNAPSAGGWAAEPQPEFIEKQKTIYFEVETNIWQAEDLVDTDKIIITKVTYLGEYEDIQSQPPIQEETAQIYPPTIEDCVAVETIRRGNPKAFEHIIFSTDKQSRYVKNIWNISHTSGIYQKKYENGVVMGSFFYEAETGEGLSYCSIEKKEGR